MLIARRRVNHSTIMNDTTTCIFVCNKLLRGELAAIDSYEEAISKTEDLGQKETLQQILDDHRKSAGTLSEHVSGMGAKPDSDAGPWGSFAEVVTGAAALLGEAAVLSALMEGEEHGIREYEGALHDPGVMNEIKVVFRDTHIPRLQKHIVSLENLKH